MARWHALSEESRETFWRSLQTLNGTRVVIAFVLLLYISFDRGARAVESPIYAETCIAYLLVAIGFAAATVYARRRFLLQLMVQIATDISVISLLYAAGGGVRSGLAILYLFPLAGSAILAPLVLALFCASVVALFMLAQGTVQALQGGEVSYTQVGLYGVAYFAVVLVVSRLAAKLIGQEELAVRRGVDLAIQQAINYIVVADMGDGVLVMGRDGSIVSANPAAQQMLGLATAEESGARLADAPALAPIGAAFEAWLDNPKAHRDAYVNIKPFSHLAPDNLSSAWAGRRDLAVHLKLRFARVDTPPKAAERYVVFMEDVTAIENQAQELKLASMGRLTASIAHEVRNPLSAIGHATALLAEDLTDQAHVRLLKIVSDNVSRVNRMVEDILQLSRKVQPNAEPLELAVFLAELRAEFNETHELADDIVWLGATGEEPVRFDALHLREVLVNLLNNAIRYASGTPGCIRLYVVSDAAGRMELHVQDDGPGITPEVRAHLFEPFYTTSSKGTGLGLYLARELCLNNGASLDYEYRFDAHAFGLQRASGRFVITFGERVAV